MHSFPIDGGCQSETGDLVLRFRGSDGEEFDIIVPFDQSLVAAEMVKKAAEKAIGHERNRIPEASLGEDISTNWQVHEAQDILIGHEPESGTPILSIRTTENLQFSLKVDQKIFENLGFNRAGIEPLDIRGPFATVAIDIDYLQKIWGTTFAPPSGIELRWSVAALRRLLIEGYLGSAWRHAGFDREPTIPSPDVIEALEFMGIELRHVAVMFAGGGSVDGTEMSAFGLARVHNKSTGKGPDADEGFAVANVCFARDSRKGKDKSEHDAFLYKSTRLSEFLSNPSVIRRGRIVKRRDFLQFYAKWGGGVHLDEAKGKEPSEMIDLINEVRGKHDVFGMNGTDFELFSIGHLLAKAPDLDKLKLALLEQANG